jgi:hypothetical protein
MQPDAKTNAPHLFDRMQFLCQCAVESVYELNRFLPVLEGDVEGEVIAYQTDDFRVVMDCISDNGRNKRIAVLMQPNAESMHRKFYCWNFTSEDAAQNAWMMITHRNLRLFKQGVLMFPKDFTKSMALLQTMEK